MARAVSRCSRGIFSAIAPPASSAVPKKTPCGGIRNILLAQGTRGEHVGYLLSDCGRRFVQWLGFIERSKARTLKAARPVRLVDITRIGTANEHAPEWQDLSPDAFAHGCLTEWGGERGVREERVSGWGQA